MSYDDSVSNPAKIPVGVPQGSILGPLLFFIYVNDIPKCLEKINVTLYTDDTAVCYSSRNLPDLIDTINHDFLNISKWLSLNQLTLNVTKSKFMIVGSRQKMNAVDPVNLSLVGKPLFQSDTFTYLGVKLNTNLSWTDHVHWIYAKVLKKLSLFKRIKCYLPCKETLF